MEIKKSQNCLKSKIINVPRTVKIPSNSGDMVVVTKAKNLVKYIFEITQNAPKKYRYTFIAKLQNFALELIENLYRANEIQYKNAGEKEKEKKSFYINEALCDLKLIEYFSMLMFECECLLFKQYEQIIRLGVQCNTLIVNWKKAV